MTKSTTLKARVVSAHGRHYGAKTEDGQFWHCYTRGKKTNLCVGDWVEISKQGNNEARVEQLLTRQNLLYRSDEMRSKQFASNIDLLFIVVAVVPEFSDDLIGRALIAALNEDLNPLILLNKVDLTHNLDKVRHRLALYKELNVEVIECSIKQPDQLKNSLLPLMANKTSILLGQSGMGKSSILNILNPQAEAPTQEHSIALGTGKHTTTLTQMYEIPAIHAQLIDSPGFQAFGLFHLQQKQIEKGFPEFAPYIGLCKFYNCQHLHEPSCAVLKALEDKAIRPQRYELYTNIVRETR